MAGEVVGLIKMDNWGFARFGLWNAYSLKTKFYNSFICKYVYK